MRRLRRGSKRQILGRVNDQSPDVSITGHDFILNLQAIFEHLIYIEIDYHYRSFHTKYQGTGILCLGTVTRKARRSKFLINGQLFNFQTSFIIGQPLN